MSTLSQFAGSRSTTQIINSHSSGGTSSTNIGAATNGGTREVLSGSLTANTLSTLLTVTGGGRVPQLSAYAKDATSRTIRLVVEVDGVTAFDATSAAVTASNAGIFAAGGGTNPLSVGEPIVFNSSLVVRVASSITETNLVAIAYSLVRG